MRPLLAALALLLVGNAKQVSPGGFPGFTIARPQAEDWGPLALAVVDLKATNKRAPGYYCEPDNGDPNSICLGATMFDQPGRIRTLIAATPGFEPAKQAVFRTIGRHAAIRIGGGRSLALLEQTESGYAWVPWRAAVAGKSACLPEALIARFSVTLPQAATTGANGERCFELRRRG